MKDRFSFHANEYARFRPTYPPRMYDFIFSHVDCFDVAWDAGTGNGQAARELATVFNKVYATDISAYQIENAWKADNIFYSIGNEQTSLENSSVDLITVAQAAHWFDMEIFSREAGRVLKPHGLVAVWGYGLLTINHHIDALILQFYKDVIGPYWDHERRHIDEHYQNLYFPFHLIHSPQFAIEVEWTLQELKGYLNTWSALKMYIKKRGDNPLDELIHNIRHYWPGERQLVKFPLFLKLGKVK